MESCESTEATAPNLATYLCPTAPAHLNHFAEVIVCEVLEIPPQKPPKEHIANVTHDVRVTDVEIIKVALGDRVRRKKIVVSGHIKVGVEYSALDEEQQIHFFHTRIPFCALIGERPCTDANRGLLPGNFNPEQWTLHVCLEHEQYHQISPRLVKATLVLLVWYAPKSKAYTG